MRVRIPPRAPTETTDEKTVTVLIVDDEPSARRSLLGIISAWEGPERFRTIEVMERGRVLDLCRREAVDAVVTRPGPVAGHGERDLVAVLRKEIPEIFVVVSIAPADYEARGKALRLGAAEFLDRPVDPEEAVLVLRSVYWKILANRAAWSD